MTGDDTVTSLSGGDKALARVLRSGLERLAEGAGGENLQWMARDALAGKFDLRLLATSPMFEAEVTRQFDRMREWRAEVGEAEFRAQASQAKDIMDSARDAIDKQA